MTPILHFTNYKKTYAHGTKIVLSIPELALNKGIYWLKGANGLGKTSLLKSVAGLIPFDGDIFVEETADQVHYLEQQMTKSY